jgi:hypothetical protein
VQRLIDQTNTELDGPENRRRLAAIAQLKAAVAATEAEREAGTAPARSEADRQTPYRSDLERVVRPRRPVVPAAPAATARPAVPAVKPPPLVLVSEQRIDRPRSDAPAPALAPVPAPVPTPAAASAAPAATPVRPRRVAAPAAFALPAAADDDDDGDDPDNLFADSRGFADYAERVGAESLADLLEAAAAYAAAVEGRPSLSRPHMFRIVEGLVPDRPGRREEMLIGFGQLLREGRIEKVRRGQFAAAEGSRFVTPGQARAG